MNKQIANVFETKNYCQFKKLKKNRDINPVNVRAAKERLLNTQKTCVVPIIVNKKMEVVDGQHRLEACKQLGIPVRFIRSNEIRDQDIPTIQGGRKWSLIDYVQSYVKRGHEEFVYLYKSYCNSGCEELMGIGSFGVLFQGQSFTSAQLSNPNFKLTPHMRKNFAETSAKLNEVLLVRPDFNPALRTEKWVKAICLLIRNPRYNHKHLMAQLKAFPGDLMTSRQQAPVNDFLLNLYNEGLKENKRVYSL